MIHPKIQQLYAEATALYDRVIILWAAMNDQLPPGPTGIPFHLRNAGVMVMVNYRLKLIARIQDAMLERLQETKEINEARHRQSMRSMRS